MPKLPSPSLTLPELDRGLNTMNVRPTEIEWRPLDPGSYAMRLPGMKDEIRGTTSATIFDDHFENHQFLSRGCEVLQWITEPGADGSTEASASAASNFWRVVTKGDGRPCEVLVVTQDGTRPVTSLGELLDSLDRLGSPSHPDQAVEPEQVLRPLG